MRCAPADRPARSRFRLFLTHRRRDVEHHGCGSRGGQAMQLKDICTMEAVCCGRRTRALEAARLMRDHHVGDLIVVDDPEEERTPVGVITDRDLVLEVLGTGLDPATTEVASLLHRTLVVANESEDTAQVIDRMRE